MSKPKFTSKINTAVQPPFRWVGGKKRLLGTVARFLPEEPPANYYEPFFGGGALFFAYGYKATNCHLSDVCHPLMLALEELQENFYEVKDVIDDLRGMDYNDIRFRFNQLKLENFPSHIEAAGLFIALNHMCFNGVYRENSRGAFNVPQGAVGPKATAVKRTLDTLDTDHLFKAASRLEGCHISTCDFYDTPMSWKTPGLGDLVVYDPPYLAEYSQYSAKVFGEADHRRLHAQAVACATRGAKVILFNSNNELTRSIFGDPTHVVQLNRTVGNSLRGTATEAIYVYNEDVR